MKEIKKNELERFVEHWDSCKTCSTIDSVSGFVLKTINEEYKNSKHFEEPDIVFTLEKKILLLEHFEFDSGRTKKKSSKKKSSIIKEEIASFEREMKKIDFSDKTVITRHKKIDGDTNIITYEKNLTRILENHLKNYDRYCKNFVAQHPEIQHPLEFGFIIENTTPLGDHIIVDEQRLSPVLPFHFRNFRNFLESNHNIKHIFYLYTFLGENKMLYFSNDKIARSEVNDTYEKINICDFEYLELKPNMIESKMHIDIKS